MRDKWMHRLTVFLKGWGYSIIIALVIAFSFRSAVAEFNDIPTGSMKPTILEGDRILVNKLAYDLKIPFTTHHIACWDEPQRGDIVVFFSPKDGKRLIKRVIGIPGDTIVMVQNILFINGKPLEYEGVDEEIISQISTSQEANYLFFSEIISGRKHAIMIRPMSLSRDSFGPVVVPEKKYFMLGDNRDNSADSRFFGFVDRDLIVGRAVGIFMSLKPDEHYLPRWDRFFKDLS